MRRNKDIGLDGELSLRVVAEERYIPAEQEIGREWIMDLMDTAVRVAAGARTRGGVRTATVMNVDFERLPKEGDVICVYTTIAHMGHTSVTVSVVTYALRCFLEQRVRLTTADYVVVAVDDQGLPRMLPTT
jgi:acyl-CoA thioesterase YciA